MISLLLATVALLGDDKARWWNEAVETSISRNPERRGAWASLLTKAAPSVRDDLAYLLADLPSQDLETLAPEALMANVELAEKVRGEVPWGETLPVEVFRDAVLPHASVTEPRDPMRAEFRERYLSIVRGCKTPGDAALKLNAALFRDYKVTYNTRRLRTDQCARESIAQGMATCTGLSIMLVEAARAVGIPSRVAGIRAWPGRGGNHTWVEVWDDGWHFVGAAEPDPAGLDHAWFVGDAGRAVADVADHAVWAATYRKTGSTFPMVWNSREQVNAENVTNRYATATGPPRPRLMVEVRLGGERVEAEVKASVLATGESRLSGTSLGPRADINLHLSAPAMAGERLLVAARYGDRCATKVTTVDGDTVVRVDLDNPPADDETKVTVELLADRFGSNASRREVARNLLRDIPHDQVRGAVAWRAYKRSPLHAGLRKEWDERVVKTADRTSSFLWRSVGNPAATSRALVIAMHGGGAAPKRVNDAQWQGMFDHYYRDHPEAGDYVYLALRAPNDEWNGFYDDSIAPLIERLILQTVLFADVDPDRVCILGASHGGYGAFVIGTKLPDRFAAIHASASAPTPGETMGENLRNVRFTFMVGENDTAYGRADRCRAFAKELEGWKGIYGGFPGGFEWKPGVGHSVPDRDKLDEMLRAGPRDPRPSRLIWAQSDTILHDQYWVEAPRPVDGGRVEASAADNVIRLKLEKQESLALWLGSPLVDLSKPITIEVEGRPARSLTVRPSLGIYCDGLERRGDPRLCAPVRVEVGAPR